MSELAAKRPKRAIRSDAVRNRLALLDAAKTLFAAGGAGVTLESIAGAANVGIGTLYRHFPTREALYEAVYARDIDAIVALGADELGGDDPVAGLRHWLHAAIDMVATKKGMIAALAIGADTTSAISQRFTGRLIAALDLHLARAIGSGQLRDDLSSEDLLLALVGMCMLRHEPNWQQNVRRLIDTLLMGLSAE